MLERRGRKVCEMGRERRGLRADPLQGAIVLWEESGLWWAVGTAPPRGAPPASSPDPSQQKHVDFTELNISCSQAGKTEMLFCSQCRSPGGPRRKAAAPEDLAAPAPGLLSSPFPFFLLLLPKSHAHHRLVATRSPLFLSVNPPTSL